MVCTRLVAISSQWTVGEYLEVPCFGIYHSRETLTTTQLGYGTVMMCDQHKIGAKWERRID